jgi:predicted ATP-grasp superfamily ATP-dependent carboligase
MTVLPLGKIESAPFRTRQDLIEKVTCDCISGTRITLEIATSGRVTLQGKMKFSGSTSVLILDGEWRGAPRILHCLGHASGIRTHVLSHVPDVASRFSRYCARFHLRPAGITWEDGLLEAIENVASSSKIDVLLPVAIPAAAFIAKHATRLARLAALHPVHDANTIETCRDKWRFAHVAAEHGIPVPQTVLFTGDARDDLKVFERGTPVLLKPRISSNGRGIMSFADKGEAELFLDSHPELARQFVAQPRLEGQDFGCNVLCRHGNIVAHTIQKAVFRPRQPFGVAAGIEIVPNDEVLEISRRLVSALRYHGVANIDLRYDQRERQLKILELNSRYWGTLLGSLYAGVNFPHLSCMAALGQPIHPSKYRHIRYFSAWGLGQQWLSALRGVGWPPQPPSASVFRYFCADPFPDLMSPFLRKPPPP